MPESRLGSPHGRSQASPRPWRATVERFTQYLTLVGARRPAGRRRGALRTLSRAPPRPQTRRPFATLKSLGGDRLTRVRHLSGTGGSALQPQEHCRGLAIGAALPFVITSVFRQRAAAAALRPALHPGGPPGASAFLYGLLTALTFALWPLGRARMNLPASAPVSVTRSPVRAPWAALALCRCRNALRRPRSPRWLSDWPTTGELPSFFVFAALGTFRIAQVSRGAAHASCTHTAACAFPPSFGSPLPMFIARGRLRRVWLSRLAWGLAFAGGRLLQSKETFAVSFLAAVTAKTRPSFLFPRHPRRSRPAIFDAFVSRPGAGCHA